jgi:hypothetical protein
MTGAEEDEQREMEKKKNLFPSPLSRTQLFFFLSLPFLSFFSIHYHLHHHRHQRRR